MCSEAHRRWQLKAVAVAHRLGVVNVSEASVIIAISSAHRREALEVEKLPLACLSDRSAWVVSVRPSPLADIKICWSAEMLGMANWDMHT